MHKIPFLLIFLLAKILIQASVLSKSTSIYQHRLMPNRLLVVELAEQLACNNMHPVLNLDATSNKIVVLSEDCLEAES